MMELEINTNGEVTQASLISSDRDDFAKSALINARSFLFTPAQLPDGTAVESRIEYRTVFTPKAAATVSVDGIVREAGGIVGDPAGGEFDPYARRVLCANAHIGDDFVKCLRAIPDGPGEPQKPR